MSFRTLPCVGCENVIFEETYPQSEMYVGARGHCYTNENHFFCEMCVRIYTHCNRCNVPVRPYLVGTYKQFESWRLNVKLQLIPYRSCAQVEKEGAHANCRNTSRNGLNIPVGRICANCRIYARSLDELESCRHCGEQLCRECAQTCVKKWMKGCNHGESPMCIICKLDATSVEIVECKACEKLYCSACKCKCGENASMLAYIIHSEKSTNRCETAASQAMIEARSYLL